MDQKTFAMIENFVANKVMKFHNQYLRMHRCLFTAYVEQYFSVCKINFLIHR